ncbi:MULTISPECIES: hypothetical protein [Micrococcaceae]|uniref:hypothetical protein n=1 Tax=Micrococcaceae TaxID=1268 RepID=UPI000A5192D6|nr:hypothetical protein [Arthrobacter sp. Leaf137]MDQ1053831.1 hypothetical protein [Arthrobacter sp. SORGH_AS_0212]
MRARVLLAPAVLLSLALAGCTGADVGPGSPPAQDAVAAPPDANTAGTVGASAEEGLDVGNSRPVVSYDGLMVRRRVVIAVNSEIDADLAGLRAKLEAAAAPRGLALTDISPDVLEPAVLDEVMPELIVALPAAATLEDGRAVAGQAAGEDTVKLGAEGFHVLQTLVHDLCFTIPADDPAALAAAVETEGILSDALGSYGVTADDGKLSVSYTGPLLADNIVESVREGLARPAHTTASAVTVEPESMDGTGVDMETEPPWTAEAQRGAHTTAHG